MNDSRQAQIYADECAILLAGELEDTERAHVRRCAKRMGSLNTWEIKKLREISRRYLVKPCQHLVKKYDRTDVPPDWYARIVCVDCGKDFGFEPHPEEMTIKAKMARLLKSGMLKRWENQWLHNVKDCERLSDAQHKVFKKICERVNDAK